MLEYAARQAGRLALGLLGAVVIAAAVSAVGMPHARGPLPFLAAASHRLFDFVRLDFGHSAISGLPAASELAANLPATLALVGTGGFLAVLVGVPLGFLFSISSARRAAAPMTQLVTAVPVFCAGLAIAYGAVHLLHWPVSVNAAADARIFADGAFPMAAPAVLTVGFAGAAAVQLALRRAASLSSGEAFRTGLKRMGLSLLEIERIYVVPRVLAGLAASAGEILLSLFSAAVVAEWVFHRPGAADLFVKSVALEDWNMAALIVAVFAALTLLAEFLGRIAAHAIAHGDAP
ncbi:MAG: ABC transporter permease subunit [Alphaproteobacteria bacterium]|nr:ABC transporter permease subunit [Alphaproteobacteria bacterium]